MGRDAPWACCKLDASERAELLDIFQSTCPWTSIYCAWRPNLRDESDNHVIELAVAAQASYLVTPNTREL